MSDKPEKLCTTCQYYHRDSGFFSAVGTCRYFQDNGIRNPIDGSWAGEFGADWMRFGPCGLEGRFWTPKP